MPEEPNGFYMGPSLIDLVESGMEIAKEEVFGPVLNLMRFDDLEAAIELANGTRFEVTELVSTPSPVVLRANSNTELKQAWLGSMWGYLRRSLISHFPVGITLFLATFIYKGAKAYSFTPVIK